MQIKTTRRYYLTSVRMAFIMTKLWRKGNPCAHSWWEYKSMQPLWGVVPQKTENRTIMKVKVLVTQLCLTLSTPWTVTHQAPLSTGFSRQEHWSGLPFPSPGDLPDPGIKPRSPTLQADSLPSEPPGKPPQTTKWYSNSTSEYISKVKEITTSKRYLHSHTYCSIIKNSQDMEANCVVVYVDIKWNITQL